MLETATHSGFDTSRLSTVESRFLDRIERRTRFLRQVHNAGLGIYLSPNEDVRKSTITSLVLLCTREGELPRIRPEIIERAAKIVASEAESMQPILPHDVQYRNRLKQKNW